MAKTVDEGTQINKLFRSFARGNNTVDKGSRSRVLSKIPTICRKGNTKTGKYNPHKVKIILIAIPINV